MRQPDLLLLCVCLLGAGCSLVVRHGSCGDEENNFCPPGYTCSAGDCVPESADGDGDVDRDSDTDVDRDSDTDVDGDSDSDVMCDDEADCTDTSVCTEDGCNPATGCWHEPISGCCTGPDDCEDGNPCTTPRCEIATGTCFFDPVGEETPCEDGSWCNGHDSCDDSGHCLHEGNPCVEGCWTCNEGTDRCDVEVTPGWCFIGDACYANEALNPDNECEWCEAASSTDDWTVRSDFTPCTLVTGPDRSYDICVRGACVSPGCGEATCNAPGPNWPLPDTNQRTCYDNTAELEACVGTAGSLSCGDTPFCGQDAQYGWDLTHPLTERFTRSLGTEPVVTDNVTGLIWQGCPAGLTGSYCAGGSAERHDWSNALAYCDALSWGEHEDWRLPDRYELQSIADYGRSEPAIDPTAFPATAPTSSYFWSSSSVGDSNEAGYVNFSWGNIASVDKPIPNYVRCVRGESHPRSVQRFARTEPAVAQPVVTDAVTGLVWQGCAVGLTGDDCLSGSVSRTNWQAALTYCEELDWGGRTDWYLPNVTELASIVDGSRRNPAIDPEAFPAAPSYSWSSSSYAGSSSLAWRVSFSLGYVSFGDKSFTGYVRCVRVGP